MKKTLLLFILISLIITSCSKNEENIFLNEKRSVKRISEIGYFFNGNSSPSNNYFEKFVYQNNKLKSTIISTDKFHEKKHFNENEKLVLEETFYGEVVDKRYKLISYTYDDKNRIIAVKRTLSNNDSISLYTANISYEKGLITKKSNDHIETEFRINDEGIIYSINIKYLKTHNTHYINFEYDVHGNCISVKGNHSGDGLVYYFNFRVSYKTEEKPQFLNNLFYNRLLTYNTNSSSPYASIMTEMQGKHLIKETNREYGFINYNSGNIRKTYHYTYDDEGLLEGIHLSRTDGYPFFKSTKFHLE